MKIIQLNLQTETKNMAESYRKELVQRITKNLLDIQLLRLIQNHPNTWGYQIKKKFEADSNITLRHGALYPMLNALEKRGFLTSQKQRHNGRARKVYIITKDGKEYLRAYNSILSEQLET